MFENGDRVKISRNDKDAIVLKTDGNSVLVYEVETGQMQTHSQHNLYNPTDSAYIVRQHADTWCSVRMGEYMFLLCVGAAGADDTNPSVLVMDMKKGVIVHKSDDEIINMIRETSDAYDDDYTDDQLMFDFTRNEYI